MWITTIPLTWRLVARAKDGWSDVLCVSWQLNPGMPLEHLPGSQSVWILFWSLVWVINVSGSVTCGTAEKIQTSHLLLQAYLCFSLCLIDYLLSNWYEKEERLVLLSAFFYTVNFVRSFINAPRITCFLLNKTPCVCLPDHHSVIISLPETYGLLLEGNGIWEGIGGTSQVFQSIYHCFYVKVLILRHLKWTKKTRLNFECFGCNFWIKYALVHI